MKKLLLILFCLPMIGFGQSWEKDIFPIQNSNTSIQIYSAKQTLDQGYIVTGVFDTLFTNLPWLASILEDGFVFLFGRYNIKNAYK